MLLNEELAQIPYRECCRAHYDEAFENIHSEEGVIERDLVILEEVLLLSLIFLESDNVGHRCFYLLNPPQKRCEMPFSRSVLILFFLRGPHMEISRSLPAVHHVDFIVAEHRPLLLFLHSSIYANISINQSKRQSKNTLSKDLSANAHHSLPAPNVRLTSMEFRREFDFSFDLRVSLDESLLCQLDAHLVDASISSLILVLNVRVDVTEEQLLVILILQLQADSLSCWLSLFAQFIVHLNDGVKYFSVQDLHFHLQGLYKNGDIRVIRCSKSFD